jgi:hypothetical protein
VRLKLNGTHHLLDYVGDVNLFGDNVNTMKKNTEPLFGTSKEVGLEVTTEKTKYTCMLLSRHQNAEQNQDTTMVNTSYELRVWDCRRHNQFLQWFYFIKF